jgi:hypothetical protein
LADVGDHRLDKRLATIIEAFASYPQASIPQASGLWSQAKATYRFLKNKKVTHDKILGPHQQATQGRIGQQKVVLAIQDTHTWERERFAVRLRFIRLRRRPRA